MQKYELNSLDEFVKMVNKERLANKNKWYVITNVEVDGKKVEIKAFDTWLQIFRVDGKNYANPMERNVSGFKEDLKSPFNKQ